MTYHQRSLLAALPVVAVLMFLSSARAAQPADSEPPTWPETPSFGLGALVGTRDRPYKGLGNDTRVLPAIFYENSWVRVQGLGAAFKLANVGNVTFGLNVNYSLKGYDASDAAILAGMEDRKGGIWLGPSARWRNDFVNLSGGVSTDLSGHSNGTQVKFSLDKTFRVGGFAITPRASALWLDRKYVDYYYGVEPIEARGDRPAYAGASTVNTELGLRVGYLIAPRQSIFLDVSATHLGGAIRNSPLVDKSIEPGFRVGYIYRF